MAVALARGRAAVIGCLIDLLRGAPPKPCSTTSCNRFTLRVPHLRAGNNYAGINAPEQGGQLLLVMLC